METRTSGSVRGMEKLARSRVERFIPTLPSGSGPIPARWLLKRPEGGRDHRAGEAKRPQLASGPLAG
jgi:hypothetical protein